LDIQEPIDTSTIFIKRIYDFELNATLLNATLPSSASPSSASDNLIKRDILLADSGQYTLKVVNNSTGETADYGLAFELLLPLPADFNLDYIVDYNDLLEICENWLQPVSGSDIDLFTDDFIDFRDFAIFAENWLTTNPAYYND
jgi:hypothetical protein